LSSQIVDLVNGIRVKRLVSVHKREGRRKGKEINNLYFSPWVSPNEPLILMSVSHSIMFWNIKTIQNNSSSELGRKISATDTLRQSKRFRSPLKTLTPSADTRKLSIATENLTLSDSNPWNKKIGSINRPELLSCIKFIGKSAKKVIFNDEFDEFVTIDNEGNVYYLRLVKDNNEFEYSLDYNGNPLQSQIQ
jgi:apoptotic protease-activating factor